MKAYTVAKGSTGFDGIKRVERDQPTPGPGQALVRMRAASLNFRDLAIVSGKYMRGPLTQDTIPLSDGAGEVVAVGAAGVRSLKSGDRVVATFTQAPRPPDALGSPLDGVLAEFAAFDEDGLAQDPAAPVVRGSRDAAVRGRDRVERADARQDAASPARPCSRSARAACRSSRCSSRRSRARA